MFVTPTQYQLLIFLSFFNFDTCFFFCSETSTKFIDALRTVYNPQTFQSSVILMSKHQNRKAMKRFFVAINRFTLSSHQHFYRTNIISNHLLQKCWKFKTLRIIVITFTLIIIPNISSGNLRVEHIQIPGPVIPHEWSLQLMDIYKRIITLLMNRRTTLLTVRSYLGSHFKYEHWIPRHTTHTNTQISTFVYHRRMFILLFCSMIVNVFVMFWLS